MKNKVNSQAAVKSLKQAYWFAGHTFTGVCALAVPVGAAYLVFGADMLNPQQALTLAPEVSITHKGYSRTIHYQRDYEPSEVSDGKAFGAAHPNQDEIFKIVRDDIKANQARDEYATIKGSIHIPSLRFSPGYVWKEKGDEDGNGIPDETRYATLGNKWHANNFANDLTVEEAKYFRLKAALERKDGTWDNFFHQSYYNTKEFIYWAIGRKPTFAEKVAEGVLLGPEPKKSGGPVVQP